MKKTSYRTIALIVLLIGAALHCLYFFYSASIKQDDRTVFNFYTFISGYISAAGIVFTIFQLKSVEEEAEAIRNSVSNYNNLLTLIEVSNLASLLTEARNNIMSQEISVAHQKLLFIKPTIITLQNRLNIQGISVASNTDLPELKDLIFDFRKDIQNLDESILNGNNFNNIDLTLILKHTDDLLTYFLHLVAHLKSPNNEL